MIFRKIAKDLSHAGGHPAISAAPEEWHIRSMIEEAIWLLQLVEICGHLLRIAIEVLPVASRAIGFQLEDRQHVHVVDPVTGLSRKPIRLRVLPLPVCP